MNIRTVRNYPTAIDNTLVAPEPAEAKHDSHSQQADSEPTAEENETSAQIKSIQAVIASLLKRS